MSTPLKKLIGALLLVVVVLSYFTFSFRVQLKEAQGELAECSELYLASKAEIDRVQIIRDLIIDGHIPFTEAGEISTGMLTGMPSDIAQVAWSLEIHLRIFVDTYPSSSEAVQKSVEWWNQEYRDYPQAQIHPDQLIPVGGAR